MRTLIVKADGVLQLAFVGSELSADIFAGWGLG